jgi:hypothetical protein
MEDSNFAPSSGLIASPLSATQPGGGATLTKEQSRKLKKKARDAAYSLANRDKKKARLAAYYLENRDKIRERSAKWRAENPAWASAQNRAWKAANRKKSNDTIRAWKAANPEKVIAQNRAWYVANKQRSNALTRAWRTANPEKMKAQSHRRRARKHFATVAPPSELRAIAAWQSRIRELTIVNCYWCSAEVNPSKNGKWHIDHIVALARGGSHSAENLCIACVNCNKRKHAKPLASWSASLPQPMLAL